MKNYLQLNWNQTQADLKYLRKRRQTYILGSVNLELVNIAISNTSIILERTLNMLFTINNSEPQSVSIMLVIVWSYRKTVVSAQKNMLSKEKLNTAKCLT